MAGELYKEGNLSFKRICPKTFNMFNNNYIDLPVIYILTHLYKSAKNS